MRLVYTDILFYSILVYLIENDLRRSRHVVFNLHVQLLFVAKYRRAVFTKQAVDDLEVIFGDVCNKFEAELVAFNGEDD
ncbi:transposase, partial [Psychrobacter celer]